MARQIVVLALIFFAIVGMASANAQAPSATPGDQSSVSLGPATNNDIIGTVGGSASDYGAAPVGGPVSAGTFASLSPAEAPKSASTILQASTVAGLMVSIFVGSFFF